MAFRASSHIVGALAVRLDDRQPTQLTPRCHIAAETSANAGQDVWPLRTLVFLLVGRIETSEQRILLGRAARAVLQVAIEQELPSELTAAAIGFVADTYASDPAASRQLLQRLLAPERLRRHAHEDMSWLARKVEPISAFDPDFVVGTRPSRTPQAWSAVTMPSGRGPASETLHQSGLPIFNEGLGRALGARRTRRRAGGGPPVGIVAGRNQKCVEIKEKSLSYWASG